MRDSTTNNCRTQFWGLPPSHQDTSTSFIHLTELRHMTFCKYLCSSNCTTGKLPLLYFETMHYFCYFLLRNYPSGNTGGKDQEVWTTDVVKHYLCANPCLSLGVSSFIMTDEVITVVAIKSSFCYKHSWSTSFWQGYVETCLMNNKKPQLSH